VVATAFTLTPKTPNNVPGMMVKPNPKRTVTMKVTRKSVSMASLTHG
jgi:hypothetical protein